MSPTKLISCLCGFSQKLWKTLAWAHVKSEKSFESNKNMKFFTFHRWFSILGKKTKKFRRENKLKKKKSKSEIATLTEGTPKLPFSSEKPTRGSFSVFFHYIFVWNCIESVGISGDNKQVNIEQIYLKVCIFSHW